MNLEAKNIIIRDQIEGDLDALKVIAQEPSVKKYFTEEEPRKKRKNRRTFFRDSAFGWQKFAGCR